MPCNTPRLVTYVVESLGTYAERNASRSPEFQARASLARFAATVTRTAAAVTGGSSLAGVGINVVHAAAAAAPPVKTNRVSAVIGRERRCRLNVFPGVTFANRRISVERTGHGCCWFVVVRWSTSLNT